MATWLCLHGFTGSPDCFRPLAVANPEYRLLAPTLTGHGAPPAAWEASFEGEVERLQRWLDESSDGPVYLLGYSLGARLGLGLLCSKATHFAGAVLVGANPGLHSIEERRERSASDAVFRDLLHSRGLPAFVDAWERLPLFATQSALSAEVLLEQRRARLGHTASGLAHALEALGLAGMPDYWAELSRLDVDIAVVVGEQDPKFRRLGEAMLERLPRARLEVAPKVGHNVVLEAPHWLSQLMQRVAEGA